MNTRNILVWLPSPMGDAIMATPMLRCLRDHFRDDKIFFLAKPLIRQVLSPSPFGDEWIQYEGHNVFAVALKLSKYRFCEAILLKNSFTPALAVFLAGIPARIGYDRHNRGMLLTDKLNRPKNPDGSPKPYPMIDYYLSIASWLGTDCENRKMELSIDEKAKKTLQNKFTILAQGNPTIVFVPGGAYGTAKLWPSENFTRTADWLVKKYNANIFISVAPNPAERQVARQICRQTKNKLINLANRPASLGELKALFSFADLIITNDTGPRHIALALGRKTISLFGPNDPEWTSCDCENEVQIAADVHCAPCDKSKCQVNKRLCMESLTPEMVCDAAEKLLGKN